MRKMITPFLQNLPRTETKHQQNNIEMLPSDEIVNKILQFAASYRVAKVPENEFVNYCLN